jgi:methylase of polypeptide subunit release factors
LQEQLKENKLGELYTSMSSSTLLTKSTNVVKVKFADLMLDNEVVQEQEFLLLILQYKDQQPGKGNTESLFGSSFYCSRNVLIYSSTTLELVGYYVKALHKQSPYNEVARNLADHLECNVNGTVTCAYLLLASNCYNSNRTLSRRNSC